LNVETRLISGSKLLSSLSFLVFLYWWTLASIAPFSGNIDTLAFVVLPSWFFPCVLQFVKARWYDVRSHTPFSNLLLFRYICVGVYIYGSLFSIANSIQCLRYGNTYIQRTILTRTKLIIYKYSCIYRYRCKQLLDFLLILPPNDCNFKII
jgi:hypothetical protein